MREIKFRAWEPDTKKMVDVFGINPMVQKVYLSHQQLFGSPGDDLLLSYMPDDEYSYVRLMQFTGLKDKNGVEIYEGDIVQIPERLHMDEGGVVEYSHTGQYVLAQGSFKTSIHQMVYNGWKLEVIGNIYENPELLEQK